MDFGSLKKERESWLAMRFGCCASKVDAEDGREAQWGNGMFGLHFFKSLLWHTLLLSSQYSCCPSFT